MACNDDWCGLQSSVSWSVRSGASYYIRVGAKSSTSLRAFKLKFSLISARPVNDECSSAIRISGRFSGPFNNLVSTNILRSYINYRYPGSSIISTPFCMEPQIRYCLSAAALLAGIYGFYIFRNLPEICLLRPVIRLLVSLQFVPF